MRDSKTSFLFLRRSFHYEWVVAELQWASSQTKTWLWVAKVFWCFLSSAQGCFVLLISTGASDRDNRSWVVTKTNQSFRIRFLLRKTVPEHNEPVWKKWFLFFNFYGPPMGRWGARESFIMRSLWALHEWIMSRTWLRHGICPVASWAQPASSMLNSPFSSTWFRQRLIRPGTILRGSAIEREKSSDVLK